MDKIYLVLIIKILEKKMCSVFKKSRTKSDCRDNLLPSCVLSHDSLFLNFLKFRLCLLSNSNLLNKGDLPGRDCAFLSIDSTATATIANIGWIIEKARVPEKHLLLLYWLCQSLWLCGSQQTVEHYSRDGNTRPPDLPPEKFVYRSRSNS